MLGNISSELANILIFLLPGFVTAWIFYGLTSHPKPTQFERIVQALIFTFIIQSLLPITRWLCVNIGKIKTFGPWDKTAELSASFLLALLIGVIFAYFTNNDSFHKCLRKIGFTTRTSHPSEWFCVFSEKVTYVIIHMKDGRRLYGWPKEWPIDPNKGQIYIQLPSWIDNEGTVIDLPQLDGILINVEDIHWVEFINNKEELKDDE